jgi:putative tryptophan/tyrosine transport system substrate-binding protein
MRRREFAVLFGGVVAPLSMRSPLHGQSAPIPTVIFFQRTPPIRGDFAHFRDGLSALGYDDGRNVRIEQRYAGGNDARLHELAQSLTSLNPAVIVVDGSVAIAAVREAAPGTPIVAGIITDPERVGITNVAKPGGNLTGLSTFSDILYAKRLELLKEMIPGLRRVAVLRPSPNLSSVGMQVTQDAARSLGLELKTYDAGPPGKWAALFVTMTNDKCGALLQFVDGQFAARATELAILAAAQRLPTVYAEREFVDAGGLASYGISYSDQWRRAAGYVDRILKGIKPGDLPVEQPTRFELVINLRTAKVFGLTVPTTLLARADEVIE